MSKTYRERVNDIIMQSGHTDEDIKNLCKLRRQIAMEYDKACTILGDSNEAYERERMSKYIQARKAEKKDGEAKEIARASATERYGAKFMYAEFIKGKGALIKAIEGFVINYYTIQKESKSASMTTE